MARASRSCSKHLQRWVDGVGSGIGHSFRCSRKIARRRGFHDHGPKAPVSERGMVVVLLVASSRASVLIPTFF